MRPLYEACEDAKLEETAGNRGLWYARFFDRYTDACTLDDDAKRSWVSDNARQTGDRSALAGHAERHRALIEAIDGRVQTFATEWHFVTGLGLPHPVENGLAWHHTLGVPYLAASGVKGLVRAWVECWDESLGAPDSEERRQRIADWFGTVNDRDGSGTAGRFVFFDAVPVAPVTLAADVMTPHMGKWYEQGQEITSATDAERVPADWHDPVPVPFLVVKQARLQFGIALRPGQAKDELDEVFEALRNALAWLGAGAKTAVGYGRMTNGEAAGYVGQGDAAPIAQGLETWPDAVISYDPGKKQLSARVSTSVPVALMKGDAAERWFKELSKSAKQKLGKNLKGEVDIRRQGNLCELLAIRLPN